MKTKSLVMTAALLVALPAAATPTVVTGYVRYLEPTGAAWLSIQLSSTVGGSAMTLCGSGANTYTEAKVAGTITAEGIKMWLSMLLAARLANAKVTVYSDSNSPGTCVVVGVFMCSVAAGC